MQEKIDIAYRIKYLRENGKNGKLSQEWLAMKARIPVVTLAKIEQGKILKPAFQTIWKICKALGYTLDEFVDPLNQEDITSIITK